MALPDLIAEVIELRFSRCQCCKCARPMTMTMVDAYKVLGAILG